MFLLYKRIFYTSGKNEKGIRNYFVFPKINFLEDSMALKRVVKAISSTNISSESSG
jgi:hypothetical protein